MKTADQTMIQRRRIALHLAHRWFAYFEAPGGDLATIWRRICGYSIRACACRVTGARISSRTTIGA